VAGRDFDATDAGGREGVALVSRSTARRLFPGDDAVGRTLRREGRPLRIVGVVEDVAADRSGRRDGLFLYVPFAQGGDTRGTLAVRGPGGRPPIAEVRQAARALRPELPVLAATTLAQRADVALFPQRLAAAVTTAAGAFGLLLASVGLYGLVSYYVERKRFELAVRAALGADGPALRGLALRQGLGPVGIGLALGAAAGLGVGQVLAAFLPGIGGSDPLALAGAAGLLLCVSAAAAFIPARRAAAAAPIDALRGE